MAKDDEISIEYGWNATEESISSYFVIFLSVLAVVLILSSFLHEYRLDSVLPEAGMAIIVGVVSGLIFYFLSDSPEQGSGEDEGVLSFNATIFFIFILPPIIFNSGYQMKKEYLLRFFKPIALFSCIGTIVSALAVSFCLGCAVKNDITGGFKPTLAELMTFGALISATDPVSTLAIFQKKNVEPQLFYFVYGEAVLNDAVGLVLFHTLGKFVGTGTTIFSSSETALLFLFDFTSILVGSLLLGVFSGLIAAYTFKVTDMRNTRALELATYMLIMYLPFFFAEVFGLSGIITCLFTGFTSKEYASKNLSPVTADEANIIFQAIAHLVEVALFVELGFSICALDIDDFHLQFIILAMLASLLGRFLNIYPITLFFNWTVSDDSMSAKQYEPKLPEKIGIEGYNESSADSSTQATSSQKIGTNTAHMLWFSGLRGGVAYACVKSFPDDNGNQSSFIVTTMAIVLFTVFIMGGMTECILDKLKIKMGVDYDKLLAIEASSRKPSRMDLLEQKYIFPWVIRDYQKQDPDDEENKKIEDTNIAIHVGEKTPLVKPRKKIIFNRSFV